MYDDIFAKGERVRVLTYAELKASYRGTKNTYDEPNRFGDFMPDMAKYYGQEFVIKEMSHNRENQDYYGVHTYRVLDKAGNDVGWWFPDFCLTSAQDEEDALEAWNQIMQ